MITIDDFKKINIVVGTIKEAEEIPGSDKLFKFLVDIGQENRQILGGLKLSYTKEFLIGQKVLVLENLEPKKLMGFESQGMILAASDENDKPVIIQPIDSVPNGTIIR